MTVKHSCSKVVYSLLVGSHCCLRPASVEHDGQWYCWQHDPERVKADAEKHWLAWKVEQDEQAAVYECRALAARLAELVTPELPALLERLADYARQAAKAAKGYPDDVDCAYNDEEITRALADRIRGALEETGD